MRRFWIIGLAIAAVGGGVATTSAATADNERSDYDQHWPTLEDSPPLSPDVVLDTTTVPPRVGSTDVTAPPSTRPTDPNTATPVGPNDPDVLAAGRALGIAADEAAGANVGPTDVTAPPPTLPTDPNAATRANLDDPDVVGAAEVLGVSPSEALDRLAFQREVTAVIDSIRTSDPRYVDFRLGDGLLSAELLIEPGAEDLARQATSDLPDEVRIGFAPMTNSESEELRAAVLERAKELIGESAVDVTHQWFEGTLTLWVSDGADVASVEKSIAGVVDLPVKVDTVFTDANLMFGGRMVEEETSGGSWLGTCTSTYGLFTASGNGYLTAGHCRTSASSLFCHTTIYCTTVASQAQGLGFGSYLDRILVLHNYSSYQVTIAPGFEVDMGSTPGHIYDNGLYCKYGAIGGGSYCGYITDVNMVLAIPFTSTNLYVAWMNVQGCKGGDSGGPIWEVGTTREPRGIVTAGGGAANASGHAYCMVMSLDDQLAGTGWWLL